MSYILNNVHFINIYFITLLSNLDINLKDFK